MAALQFVTDGTKSCLLLVMYAETLDVRAT